MGSAPLHVYVFAHHHLMRNLWAKFVEDTHPKVLLCENNVHPFYSRLAGSQITTRTFSWTDSRGLLTLMFEGLFLRMFRRPVTLYLGPLMGMQALIACALFRVKRVVYVVDHTEHDICTVAPRTLRERVELLVYSCLLLRRVVLHQYQDVFEFGISESTDCELSPAYGAVASFPAVKHEHDLIVLDFDLSGFPINEQLSLERILSCILTFQNPAIKPHPTASGMMEGNTDLSVIDRSLPAEVLASPHVTILSLSSTAESSFERRIDVRDLLVFNSEEDRKRWMMPGAISWNGASWNLREGH